MGGRKGSKTGSQSQDDMLDYRNSETTIGDLDFPRALQEYDSQEQRFSHLVNAHSFAVYIANVGKLMGVIPPAHRPAHPAQSVHTLVSDS